MTTTSLGIPLYDLDDVPNGPDEMNAISNEVDALLVPRLVPAANHRGPHAVASGLSSGSNPVGSGWPLLYAVGDIAYASGIWTVARAGLYVWACTYVATASSTSSVVEVRVTVNGSAPANGDGTVVVGMNPTSQAGTAGGPIALAANDQVQLNLFVDAIPTGLTVTPQTFSLILVG